MALDISPATVKDVLNITTKETLDVGGPSESPFSKTYENNFSFGTGDGKFNKAWWKINSSLADGASEVIDLYAPGTDRFGNTITGILAVKVLAIINNNTVDGDDLVIGQAATDPWLSLFDGNNERITVKGGGRSILVAPKATGYPVANDAATGHNLQVAADSDGGNTLSYTMLLCAADATS